MDHIGFSSMLEIEMNLYIFMLNGMIILPNSGLIPSDYKAVEDLAV